MEICVKAPDAASAGLLRAQLARDFGDASVTLDEFSAEVSLATGSHVARTLSGALNTIEQWLELNEILTAEVVLDDHAYVFVRYGGSAHGLLREGPAADDPSAQPFRVLLVDDDPGIRMLCAATLADAGVEVLEAEDGRRGLERALEECPDLVLLDVSMPILDGFALARSLRDDVRTRDVPFVFLTGEIELESRAKASALGAAGFVTKPFDPRSVASLVVGLLARGAPATEPLSV